MIKPRLLILVVMAFLAACGQAVSPLAPTAPPTLQERIGTAPVITTVSPTLPLTQPVSTLPVFTPTAHLNTQTLTPTIPPTLTATAGALQMCSPLQDLTIADLFTIVTTPFKAPPPGQDSGHHGIDLAYYHRGTHTQMLGLPIYSVFTGQVTAVILNRPPYGNMVIIETPLDKLPGNLIQQVAFTPVPTLTVPDNRLSCPAHTANPAWSTDRQSLYLLYAHLNHAPLVKMGDPVACGGQLGEVGNTGESGNPHLHFETRLGPAGASFDSMSHYNTKATTAEMDNYCTWRVSGTFQMFDPLKLLALGKK